MLGRLNYDALPFYSPIAFGGAAAEVGAALIIVILLTWFRLWGYFWREWLTTVDHKRIGVMYVVLAIISLLRGYADGIMMRSQQALAINAPGYLPPDHFNQVFSAHGTLMVFFVVMAIITGLMNVVVPLQIGARDVAFPFMNAVSFYLTAAGAFLVFASLVLGVFSQGGWTGYPPFTEYAASPDTGVEYWIWALALSGLGTTLTGVNFITTIVRKRAPGMTYMRMPLFTWTVLVTAVLMVLTFPALTVVAVELQLDRLLDFHFFTNELGGNQMLYINLLWLWGHPEVYILILPAFGVFSEVVATYSRKSLFGYTSLVYATAVIGLLSCLVWLHHFFTMGASAAVNTFFGIATMIISVPTGVKIFHWIFTMRGGRIDYKPAMMWTIPFILLFVIGGMTGVMLAIPPVDYLVHNSTFLIAHFHNMLIPGALFAMFAGIMYWFPKAFGFTLDEKWGRRTVIFWVIGFILTFFPLYLTGLMGMPRRMQMVTDPALAPYLIVSLIGALCILVGIICLLTMLVVSIMNRHKLVDLSGDPWDGRTLEWMTPSPPPAYNFAVIPQVQSGDAFWYMKTHGLAYKPTGKYEDIIMPKNTPLALIIGAGSFLLGFGIVFYMWWLVGLAAVIAFGALIARSFQTDTTYVVTAAQVEQDVKAFLKRAQPVIAERQPEWIEDGKSYDEHEKNLKGQTA